MQQRQAEPGIGGPEGVETYADNGAIATAAARKGDVADTHGTVAVPLQTPLEVSVSSFYEQYGTLAILLVVGTGLYAVIMLVNRLMRPSLPHPGKLTTYECGVDAVGTEWSQMNIRYYVFAFLFVIFDVESIFLFPWAVILGGLEEGTLPISPVFALVEMFVFIAILAVGLVYAWRKKVLVWE